MPGAQPFPARCGQDRREHHEVQEEANPGDETMECAASRYFAMVSIATKSAIVARYSATATAREWGRVRPPGLPSLIADPAAPRGRSRGVGNGSALRVA